MAKANKGDLKAETLLSVLGRDAEAHRGVVNVPVYHASTILYPTVAALKKAGKREFGEIFYGRHGTPTTFALQDTVAKIEGGWRSFAFGSGKAAILASLLAYLKSGDHLLMVDSAYGPSRELATGLLEDLGISHTFYDPLIGAGIAELMLPNTRVVFTESPGSLTFEMQDLPAIAKVAHSADAIVITDNTWASPLLCNPFDLGADISVQAATKYIVGHSDAMLGMVTVTEKSYEPVKKAFEDLGASAGPDDCYLALRGMRTLAVRLAQQGETGLLLASWLAERPEVNRVLHPALPGDPGHDIWRRDFSGASGLFGVVLNPAPEEAVAAMLDGLELFGMGYSWGGYESLAIPTYPHQVRETSDWDPAYPCLRFHAGLEHPDDLIADLDAGLRRFNALL
ncbi:MAG: cystathionine beta-lyase [Rhodospirillaceae bacterium]|nr:cystathionine beta-lyase [Rhodospirillaceae bacterium]